MPCPWRVPAQRPRGPGLHGMTMSNPYKELQVDPEAEHEVIEAAYRRLARKYHPDVAPGPDAQDRMVRINQAWEVLKDPIRRAAVDRARMREMTTSARVVAADARADVRRAADPPDVRGAASPDRDGRDGQGDQGDQGERPSTASGPAGGQGPGWPLPGMDASTGFGDRADRISPDWSVGRSGVGGGYDPQTMGTAQGEGSSGPPPGNPSGSLLHFGRYAGWSLGEVARTDLEYLEWLDRMPIGRNYQFEIDALLRAAGRRTSTRAANSGRRGLFRRR